MDVRVIGVPMDLGADRRGVDMGPSAIRYAGLADAVESVGHGCTDAGDLAVARPEAVEDDGRLPSGGRAKHLEETRELCRELAAVVRETLAEGAFPLVLGGDHSIAIGSVRGSASEADVGVVWFDAHGDYNTPETTPSGNVHGMSLAAVLGAGSFAGADWAKAGVDPGNVAVVGARSLDERETEVLRESDVRVFTMSEIDRRGVSAVVADALDRACAGTDGLHVSLDLDWLDPREAPGVGTPVRGGVTYREAHAAMEMVADRELRSLELVEVNPILDDHNATAELAVELAASALGRRIL
jgi:arginase